MMAAQIIQTGITEEELLRLGAKDRWVEVTNGELLHMNPVGLLHVLLAGNLFRSMDNFVHSQNLGFVFMDGLICVLERNPKGRVITSRVPDICFIRKGRITSNFDLRKPFPGAPDLAIEVVSPDETAESIRSKIRDYLRFGGEQVWVMYPDQKELHQYIAGESVAHIFSPGDTLQAPTLLPGLQIAIADLFTLPDLDPPPDEGA
jgi:Uma2 family endonuclease